MAAASAGRSTLHGTRLSNVGSLVAERRYGLPLHPLQIYTSWTLIMACRRALRKRCSLLHSQVPPQKPAQLPVGSHLPVRAAYSPYRVPFTRYLDHAACQPHLGHQHPPQALPLPTRRRRRSIRWGAHPAVQQGPHAPPQKHSAPFSRAPCPQRARAWMNGRC